MRILSVLGMHQTSAGLEVRALLPDATEVWVIEPKTGRKVGKLDCLDSRGFSAVYYLAVKILFVTSSLLSGTASKI